MLRFDHCACGTSTAGTGTLALAATPVPPGGVDFDVWARAMGFGNSAALPVSYEIIEFTDSTFTKASQAEKGLGTLTLGATAGIANATLARTTIQRTVTAMNAQPASVSIAPATGIAIGTAANVLVLVAASAEEILAQHPYFDATTYGTANWGVTPEGSNSGGVANGPAFSTSTVEDQYIPFRWSVPMLVKRVSFSVNTYTGITGSPALYVRLYAFGSNGLPVKLLYDFTGATGVSLTGTGAYSALSAGAGYLLLPGDYFMDFAVGGLTGGTLELTAPNTYGTNNPAALRLGSNAGRTASMATATGGTAGAGPDPANTTGYSGVPLTSNGAPVFGLSPA